MDFMDDDMKTIARKAYRQPGGLYAACEAVLAEQKRRANDPHAWKPSSFYQGYEQRINPKGYLETRPIEAPQEQMTAAERDAFTRAQQEFDDGETVPAEPEIDHVSGKYALADSTPGACNWLNINDMIRQLREALEEYRNQCRRQGRPPGQK